MKSIMLRALVALVFGCAAFAVAQPIPDPPVQGGAVVDNLDGQVPTPPVQDGSGDQLRDLEIQQKLERIKELERLAARAKDGVRFKTAPEDRGRLIDEAAACRAQAGQLRQELSALRRRQAATDGKVAKLDGRMGKLEESNQAQNDLLLGKMGKDGKRSGGYTTWREGVDKLLRGPDEKEGTTDDVRYVLYGDDGDKNVREIAKSASTDAGNAKTTADTAKTAAESAKQTASSAADGWVMWLAIAAVVLSLGALVKSFFFK